MNYSRWDEKVFGFLIITFLSLMDPAFAGGIRILVLGDSLTEGYGVEKNEAYPFLLETSLKKRGYSKLKVINAGISGSTSASASSRLKWYLRANPNIMILALGANDGLRGLSVDNMKRNLGAAIELARNNEIEVLLAGMQMPLNYGIEYTESFKNAYFELAKEFRIEIIPFLLENVGGIPKHNLEDGIHPNPRGHQIVTQNVLNHLIPMLEH